MSWQSRWGSSNEKWNDGGWQGGEGKGGGGSGSKGKGGGSWQQGSSGAGKGGKDDSWQQGKSGGWKGGKDDSWQQGKSGAGKGGKGDSWHQGKSGGGKWQEQAEKPDWQTKTAIDSKTGKSKASTKGGAAATIAGGPKVALKISTPKKDDPIGLTLTGEYMENGQNHGKTSYKKIQKGGKNNADVFLYYWDNRDGADFSGWWFGDQVGGDNPKVWARAAMHTPHPPKAGWRLPWDAPKIEANALIVESVAAAPEAAEGKAGNLAGRPSSSLGVQPAARAKKATELVTSTESAANVAITNAKKVIENTSAPESQVKATIESLSRNQTKLNEAQKTLTEDIKELRKAGPSGAAQLAEVQQLATKIKTLLGSLNSENVKVTGIMKKLESEKKKKEEDAKMKAKEAADSKAFKAALPKVKAAIAKLDTAISKVESSATKLVETPAEGDELTKKQEEVEKAAEEALKQVQELRADVKTKTADARQYAPETKKEATNELGQIQEKLAESQKKLGAYKEFKKHYAARVEATKAIGEIKEKMDSAEADITKASDLVKDISKGQMTEEQVAEADKMMALPKESVAASITLINSKLRGADPVTQAELSKLRTRSIEVKEKQEAVNTRLKAQREVACSHLIIEDAKEKVVKLEACIATCQDVEMPFLKGMEVLPEEESDVAIAESEKAAKECSQALQQAKSFINLKQKATKEYKNKEVGESIAQQLTPLLARADAVEKKLENFKKETAERKISAVMAKAVESVIDAEKKATAMATAGKPLAPDKLDETDVGTIKEAIEKVDIAAKDASAACTEVKNVLAAKQSETRGPAGRDAVNKINGRLKAAQDKCDKTRQAVTAALKLVKAKEILERENERLSAAEADVDKAEAQTSNGPPNEDGVRVMEEAISSASKVLKVLPAVVKPQLSVVPTGTKSTKEKLQAVIDRVAKALEKIEKLRKGTEKERGEVFVKDAEAKTNTVEEIMAKMSELELPYLKGIEVLPLSETLDNITKSEEMSKETQDAMKDAKNFMTAKASEAKVFADAKPVTEAFAACTKRIEAAQQKLLTFNKETEGRKKGAMVQKAGMMVKELEDLVKKTTEASEPFAKEGADKMTEEEAKTPMETYLESEKEAKTKLSEIKKFIKERQSASKGNDAQLETLKEHSAKVTEAEQELKKAKKTTGVHEQRFLAAHLMEEVRPKFEALDGEVVKATEACAPLLEHGGEEYLVLASIGRLAKALTTHAKEKELDVPALFKEASAGKNSVPQDSFLKYLADLPEKIGHEEIAFSEDRRLAIFKVLDADKDGTVNSNEFEAIFKQQGVCKKEVSLTESSAVDAATICKLEPGTELELFGFMTEVDGIKRKQCKLADGKTGWVSVKGNQGGALVWIQYPFDTFIDELYKAINESMGVIKKFDVFLGQKIKEASQHPSGPLTEALAATKGELEKLRPKANEKMKALEALKNKVAKGKSTYKQKESAERNAHIELREKKQAAEITGDSEAKVEALEPLIAKVDEETKAILGCEKDDLLKFAGPATALAAAEKALAAVLDAAEAAKVVVKERLQVASEIKPSTKVSGLAKKQLEQMGAKVEKNIGKCRSSVASVKSKCEEIVSLYKSQVSKALRVEAQTKKIAVENLFEELAKGTDMSEAIFCEKVRKLEGVEIQMEHAKLLFGNIAKAEKLTKRGFLTYVQLYYVTIKDIAFSDVMPIATCKTLRKAEKDEVLEVLEGPLVEEKSGLVRVRARSVVDSTEGWVTVKGNQGTPFLKEIEKVYYCVKKPDAPLQEETGDVNIRTLSEEEILELVEGPRKIEVSAIQRGKAKADKDEKTGWTTLKDQNDVVYAAPNTKLYTCKAQVAMTDGVDIKTCKVIRKLAEGEQFEASAPPSLDADSGIERLSGKALKDGKIGWITTKGNAGTVYAEADAKKYFVEKEVDLQDRCQSGAKIIRKLEAGETFTLLEGPKEEKAPIEYRVKVRCVSDGKVGWVKKKMAGLKVANER